MTVADTSTKAYISNVPTNSPCGAGLDCESYDFPFYWRDKKVTQIAKTINVKNSAPVLRFLQAWINMNHTTPNNPYKQTSSRNRKQISYFSFRKFETHPISSKKRFVKGQQAQHRRCVCAQYATNGRLGDTLSNCPLSIIGLDLQNGW